jgi:hypothetical protein
MEVTRLLTPFNPAVTVASRVIDSQCAGHDWHVSTQSDTLFDLLFKKADNNHILIVDLYKG